MEPATALIRRLEVKVALCFLSMVTLPRVGNGAHENMFREFSDIPAVIAAGR
jgi:hypothetical protein